MSRDSESNPLPWVITPSIVTMCSTFLWDPECKYEAIVTRTQDVPTQLLSDRSFITQTSSPKTHKSRWWWCFTFCDIGKIPSTDSVSTGRRSKWPRAEEDLEGSHPQVAKSRATPTHDPWTQSGLSRTSFDIGWSQFRY